tara:strand:+ start:864 stop:1094 length:231 start_codon:yes stop_codon:yes gene_type:complete
LYKEGHEIILFSARYMGRTNGNVEKAYKIGYKFTFSQLKKWGVNFHTLILGKPSYDLLVDDKAYNYDDSWKKKIKI